MSQYIPNTDDDVRGMLTSIGVNSFNDLIADIPEQIRLKRSMNIPGPLSELELKRHFNDLLNRNPGLHNRSCFFGGGSYRHFIPSLIGALTSRAEFYTAYTPYQPEISQGTLQGIFEYQTLVCQLTGMDVSNASMYDGATALAESVLMAMRMSRKKELIISRALNPLYYQVIKTYIRNTDAIIKEIGWDDTGRTSMTEFEAALSGETCAVLLQNPNFFGVIEDVGNVFGQAHGQKAVTIYGFSEAMSMGLLKPPAEQGADIVSGEGQSFGIPVSFGGPYLGILASTDRYVRKMPGRIVGQTVDTQGRRGYVLTLSTREQHIRREKATSNICTNEGLCALTAAMFLTTLGKKGLYELAVQNVQKTKYAMERLAAVPALKMRFTGPVFNEFVVQSPVPTDELNNRLREHGIIGGIPLECYYPELADSLLFCFTETNTRNQIDHLAETLAKIL